MIDGVNGQLMPPPGTPPHSGTPGTLKAICAPSGDQLPGQPGIDVPIGETPLPSTFISASRFPPPNRPVENAILVASGDQTGDQSAAGSLVSRTRPVPLLRSISQVNAIRVP